ncbi:helix-turn-helix domain-containing protein [bacterium]|nr:helix-turn-helix domain-containing protein [bacterium]
METRKYKSYVKTDEENILNEVVGQRLKIARRNAKLTQTKLAKKLNISFQQIGKYEKGQNGLNAIRIVQISNLLNIPKSYLLENIELPGFVELPGDDSVSSHSESFNV